MFYCVDVVYLGVLHGLISEVLPVIGLQYTHQAIIIQSTVSAL